VESLHAPDYSAFRNHKVDDPTPGTFRWIWENDLARSWLEKDESSTLWIRGSPGQGKTVLSKFLLNALENQKPSHGTDSKIIYFFFYDQDERLRTGPAALRSLIKQLLSVADLFHHVVHVIDINSPEDLEDTLGDILERMLQDPALGRVYCILDALDECEDESRVSLLKRILRLHSRSQSQNGGPILKLLVTSRPIRDIARKLGRFPCIDLKANPDDLKIFIDTKVADLSHFTTNLQKDAAELLLSGAGRTFLWISFVLKKLEKATLPSPALLRNIVATTPTDLNKLYQSIIDRIMQDSLERQKLLTWVVYSRQPLTLQELEAALATQINSTSRESTKLYHITLTAESITEVAGEILEISNGRVHLIHQSARDFLLRNEQLKTSHFCNGQDPNIYIAKICMKYLTFEDFETGPCGDPSSLSQRKALHPLLHYAAHNWHAHVRSAGDVGDMDALNQLTKPGGPKLLAWTEAAGIRDLENATSLWEVATKAEIAWLADIESDDTLITEERVEEIKKNGITGYVVVERFLSRGDSKLTAGAVLALIKSFNEETVRLLFDKHPELEVTPAMVKAAASNTRSGDYITKYLLGKWSDVLITADLVEAAAQNPSPETGKDIIKLLMRQRNAPIAGDAVAAIAQLFDVEVMQLLLDGREGIRVTDSVIQAAAKNKENGMSVVHLLLSRGMEVEITENLMKWVAGSFDTKMMKLLVDRSGRVTPEVIQAAAGNSQHARGMMELLLNQHAEIVITEEMVTTAMKNRESGIQVIRLLLDRSVDIEITAEVIRAATSDWKNGLEMMGILLEQRKPIIVTEEMVKAIGTEGRSEVLQAILERGSEIITTAEMVRIVVEGHDGTTANAFFDRAKGIEVTEELVEAAMKNDIYGKYTIKLLLEKSRLRTATEGMILEILTAPVGRKRRGLYIDRVDMKEYQFKERAVTLGILLEQAEEIQVTEEAVAAIAKGSGSEAMTLLLNRCKIEVTEDVIRAAAKNPIKGKEVMRVLLDRWSGDEISEDVVEAVIRTRQGGAEMLELLLSYEKHIRVTEGVLRAAAEDYRFGFKSFKLLLDRSGESEITDEVIRVAASNHQNGKEMVELLLDRSRKTKITEEVMKAAARNSGPRNKTMELLLDRCGETGVTEEVVKAAASSGNHKETIELLLDRCGGIEVTAEVMKAAVHGGREVVQLLLDRCEKVWITEEIMIAAASAYHGERVIKLLLDRNREIMITEEIMIAAASTYHGERVIKLLLDRNREIMITEEVIRAGLKSRNDDMAKFLLFSDRVTEIGEGTVKAIVEFCNSKTSVLFFNRHRDIEITRGVLEAATRNKIYGADILEWLFNQPGKPEIPAGINGNKRGSGTTALVLGQDKNAWVTEDLMSAVAGKHPEVMEMLLDRGGEACITQNTLMRAAESDDYKADKVIKLLLNRAGNMEITEEVMKAAAGNTHESVIDVLLCRGANTRITEGVMQAAARNEGREGIEILELLLKQSGNVGITEEVLKAAVWNATYGEEFLELLLEYDGAKTITQETIKAAATLGEWRIFRLLSRKCNTDLVTTNWAGIFRLFRASKAGYSAVVRQLLHDGVDPNLTDQRGCSPLWLAAANDCKSVVQTLLNTGAVDMERKCKNGRSPLFVAVEKGHQAVARLLLGEGASLTLQDNDGRNALSIAKDRGYTAVVKLLERYHDASDLSTAA